MAATAMFSTRLAMAASQAPLSDHDRATLYWIAQEGATSVRELAIHLVPFQRPFVPEFRASVPRGAANRPRGVSYGWECARHQNYSRRVRRCVT
jgi:hypothetical protein